MSGRLYRDSLPLRFARVAEANSDRPAVLFEPIGVDEARGVFVRVRTDRGQERGTVGHGFSRRAGGVSPLFCIKRK